MVPWQKPENYKPEVYELARRYYRAHPDAGPLIGFWPTLPNRKSDINSSVGISTNLLDGSSWEYPDAGYENATVYGNGIKIIHSVLHGFFQPMKRFL
jgi:hypothetical protein